MSTNPEDLVNIHPVFLSYLSRSWITKSKRYSTLGWYAD